MGFVPGLWKMRGRCADCVGEGVVIESVGDWETAGLETTYEVHILFGRRLLLL